MQPTKVVLDTNVLIDNPEAVFKYPHVILPYTVLGELDKHKRNPDLKRAAQQAIKCIKVAYNKGTLDVVDLPTEASSPDEKIIASCVKHGTSFITQDIGAYVIAKANNVPIVDEDVDDDIDSNYLGYKTSPEDADIDYEQSWKQLKEVMLVEFKEKFDYDLRHNEYYIVTRGGYRDDIWKRAGDRVVRVSQSSKPLKSAGIVDLPLDSVQQIALDAVMDPDVSLTVIDGTLGTGKTILTLMGALACTAGQRNLKHYKKVLVTRPPISTDAKLRVGFLPGTLEDKLGDWIGGVKSNLKFLFEKDLEKSSKEAAKTIFDDYFEMINLESIQGVSLHDVILIVDEYQLLDRDSLKLVISRIAQGAKLVLVGDTAGQTYGINRSNEGFRTLYKFLGKRSAFNYVKLDKIYRSELSKFVDEVFA